MNKFTRSTILAGMLGASTIALTMAMSTSAFAQSTSSAIRGVVTGQDGQPVTGAKVTIVYGPTGRVATATTQGNGAYSTRGLRVGGPYTITVTAPGAKPEVKEGVRLEVGDTKTLNFDLAALAAKDEIIVVGQKISDVTLNTGAGSAFSSSDIENQPSIGRDLTDTLLRDPLTNGTGTTGELVIGGMNPRFNAISIDGIQGRDDFGLRSSTYSGNRSPVSLDVIESAALLASDYSVLNSGFRGGLINVVTKSGTNDFHGTAFYQRSGDGFQGSKTDGRDVTIPPYKEETYGATLSGPIIKDKLFFIGNYEKFSTAVPSTFPDNGNLFTVDAFSLLAPYIQTNLNFDPGVRGQVLNNPTTNEKILAKLDWDINEKHRASIFYRRSKDASQSISSTRFTSANYQRPIKVDNYGGQLYSDWTDNFSTEFRAGYRKKDLGQICNAGTNIGEIRIRLDPSNLGDAALQGDADLLASLNGRRSTFTAGCDRFRHANSFTDKRTQLFGKGTYLWGNHTLTGGAAFQDYSLQNFFVFDSLGRFTFNSLDDLISGTGSVSYRNAQSNNVSDAAAAWGYQKLSLFAQDEWQATPDILINAGLRYETFIQSDQTPNRVDFQNAYGRSSQKNLDGVDILMPRIGITYTPFDRTKITGGAGLFAGGNPLVWVSNAFQPQIFGASGNFTNLDPTVIPQALLDSVAASDPTSQADIDLIDPNFRTPSTWKYSIKLQQNFDLHFGGVDLGDDYTFTAQYLHSKDRYGFRWVNLAQTELASTQPPGVAPDGRPIYANLSSLGIHDAIELTNSKGGSGDLFTVGLSKDYDFGGSFAVDYTYADVNSVTPGSSSRGISSLRATIGSDRNNPAAGRSPYNTLHKIGVSLSYHHDFFEDLTSRFNIFGVITSGEPYSYTFDVRSSNPLFGRSSSGSPYDNDLMYIPTYDNHGFNDPTVVFGANFDQHAFLQYITEHDISTGIVGRNKKASAWNQLWNFRFTQDLPFADFGQKRFKGNKLQAFVDIFNFPNLIDSNWGTFKRGQGFDTLRLVQADIVSAADVNNLGVAGAPALTGDAPRTTCTTAAACVYRFNNFRADRLGFQDLNRSLYKITVGIKYKF